MSNQVTRTFKIESNRSDSDKESFYATLSTEHVVDRPYGGEILLHDSDSIDLSRAPLPLLISHNSSELNIGVIEKIEIIGRKLKGNIRLGKSSRALEVLKDIQAGILTSLSVGYEIEEHRMEGDNLIATKWAPFECSLVSVGADPYAGIGRSLKHNLGNNIMNNIENNSEEKKLSRREKQINNIALEDEQYRTAEILAIGKKRGFTDIAIDYVKRGLSLDEFREKVISLTPVVRAAPSADDMYSSNGNSSDYEQKFSIVKAIRSIMDPRSVDAGFEHEMSQELRNKTGYRGKELLIPFGRPSNNTMNQRAMNIGTPSAGGYMVETVLDSDRFIDALLPQSTILNLGITQMSDLRGDVSIPRAISEPGISAYNLDNVDSMADTSPVFDQISLSPKSLAGLTIISHKMLSQGSLDTESMVRRMLASSIGAEMDRQCIQGDGLGSNVNGVTNTTGIGARTYANGGNPDWADIVQLEALLEADNVAMSNIAYLVHPTMAATLKTTEVAASTGRFILENGMMNGQPVHVSTNVPVKSVLIGAWSEFILGTWGVLALDIDPYSDFRKANVEVRAIMDWDASVRHPEAFAVLTEAAV